MQKLRRSPRIFIPTPSRFLVVIPFKTISVLLIIFFFLTSAYLLLRSDVFLVKEIGLSWQGGPTASRYIDVDALREQLARYRATSIVLLKTKDVESQLLSSFFPLRSVKVRKDWPDRLEIKLTKRNPLAVLQVLRIEQISSEERREVRENYLVGEDGILFAVPREDDSYPVLLLKGEKELKIGDSISNDLVRTTLTILGRLAGMKDIAVEKVSISDQGIIYVDAFSKEASGGSRDVQAKWRVTFLATQEIDQQISSLQAIVKEAKIKGRKLRDVDLRYNPPVVRW